MKQNVLRLWKILLPSGIGAAFYYVFFWKVFSLVEFLFIIAITTVVTVVIYVLIQIIKAGQDLDSSSLSNDDQNKEETERFILRGNQRISVQVKRIYRKLEYATHANHQFVYGYYVSSYHTTPINSATESTSGLGMIPFEKIDKSNQDIMVNIDDDGIIKYVSEAVLTTFNLKSADVLGKNITSFSHVFGKNYATVMQEIHRDYHAQSAIEIQLDGETKWFLWSYEAVLNKHSDIDFILAVGHDITTFVQSNGNSTFDSRKDYLTGLLNQQGLYEAISKMKNVQRAVSYFIDIKAFSKINDYYGHSSGDEVLVSIANALRTFDSDECLVSRFSGDKFVVFCINNHAKEQTIHQAKEQFKTFLSQEVQTAQFSMQIEKCIGYAVYPDDSAQLDKLISLSSLAMKESSKQNGNEIVHYHVNMSEALRKNFQISNKLRTAIEEEIIEIHFQEVIDISTGEVLYVEELARWHDDDLGWISPEEFIATAKESSLLDKLERYLIDKAVNAFKEIKKKQRYKKTKLSLNITPASLLDLNFLYYLNRIVARYRLDKEDVCIEISEGTFVNNLDLCFARINEYKQAGYLIALDDFGKEYSSLAILENVAFDIIKIDALFTENIVNIRSQEIVKMIRKITKISNKDIIAEGVETITQRDILKRLGCLTQQGFLHHRPERME